MSGETKPDRPHLTAAVAVACYNQAHYLDQAIESVLAQTHQPDEIIVVDDGSTDNTREVAARFPEVRYVYQPNRGLGATRNRAMATATSDVIIFLDADDRLRPEAVAIGMWRLAERPELAFVSGGYVRIDGEGRVLTAPTPAAVDDGENYRAFLRANYVGMHGTVAYRRAVVEEAGGFDTDLASCEDYDLYLRLSRTHPVATHQEIVAEYRTYPGSMSSNDVLMFSIVMSVLRAQRPHVAGQAESRAAMVAGRSYWFDLYGKAAIRQSVRAIRHGPRRRGLRDLVATCRIAPRSSRQMIFQALSARLDPRRTWRRRTPPRTGQPAEVQTGEDPT